MPGQTPKDLAVIASDIVAVVSEMQVTGASRYVFGYSSLISIVVASRMVVFFRDFQPGSSCCR
jgi:hypothetical protein